MANGAPRSRSAAAAAKAAAAEAHDATYSFEWRGVSFSRKAKLPATFAFDLADVEESNEISAVVRLLVGLLGQEQVAMFRQKITDDGDALDDLSDILSDFLGAALGPAGVTPGESPASDDS